MYVILNNCRTYPNIYTTIKLYLSVPYLAKLNQVNSIHIETT